MNNVTSLGGILSALVSPLHRDGDIDVDGTRRLIDYVLEGGVNGVVALGSTGVAQVDLDSVPKELRAAEKAGASAALVTPP